MGRHRDCVEYERGPTRYSSNISQLQAAPLVFYGYPRSLGLGNGFRHTITQ